jgi:hypothetical protein
VFVRDQKRQIAVVTRSHGELIEKTRSCLEGLVLGVDANNARRRIHHLFGREGEVKIDFQASNPAWKKWLPSWPTSPHWYDKARFRRYMAAHIANRERITVREFISEFDGMSGTAKQKAVLAETGTSHLSLHDFFGRSKANSANIEKLLAALKAHTAPVKTASLGVIGKDHFFRMMEAAGGDTKTFNYQLRLFETDGVPHVVEFAFGVLSAGLTAGAPRGPTRITVTGVNCSPGIRIRFNRLDATAQGWIPCWQS